MGSGVSVTRISAGRLSATSFPAAIGAADATKRFKGNWGWKDWREYGAGNWLMGLRKLYFRICACGIKGGLKWKNDWAAVQHKDSIVVMTDGYTCSSARMG